MTTCPDLAIPQNGFTSRPIQVDSLLLGNEEDGGAAVPG